MTDNFAPEFDPLAENPTMSHSGNGGDTGDAELPEDAVESVADSNAALAEALAVSQDRYLRLAAEYDNFRRRTIREKGEAGDRGAIEALSRLLDVLDDLERLDTTDSSTTIDVFREGFSMVYRKLQQALEGAGLERIVPVGVTFDPEEHEAVSVIAPLQPEQDHQVALTLQTGYRFRGRVIRPARVQVYSEQGTA